MYTLNISSSALMMYYHHLSYLRLDIRKKCFFFYSKGSEALEQVVQIAGRCPIPEGTQGQAGQGSEHFIVL